MGLNPHLIILTDTKPGLAVYRCFVCSPEYCLLSKYLNQKSFDLIVYIVLNVLKSLFVGWMFFLFITIISNMILVHRVSKQKYIFADRLNFHELNSRPDREEIRTLNLQRYFLAKWKLSTKLIHTKVTQFSIRTETHIKIIFV